MDRYPRLLAPVLVIAILFAAGAAYAQISSGHMAVCRGASRIILTGGNFCFRLCLLVAPLGFICSASQAMTAQFKLQNLFISLNN